MSLSTFYNTVPVKLEQYCHRPAVGLGGWFSSLLMGVEVLQK